MDILTTIDVIYKFASVATLGFMSYQIWQNNIQFLDKKNQDNIRHQKDEKQKAIELADYYSKLILENISYLDYVFKNSGIQELVEEINDDNIREFDVFEMQKMFSKSKYEIIKEKIYSINLKILVTASTIIHDKGVNEYVNGKVTLKIHENLVECSEKKTELYKLKEEIAATKEENQDIQKVLDNKYDIQNNIAKYEYYVNKYNNEFNSIIIDTLNKLEYFSMWFNVGLADESVVYQSLHQSFLGMVKMMYFYISIQNEDGKNKYYTNIIELYNLWIHEYKEKQNDEVCANRSNIRKSEKIQKEASY